MPHLESNWTVSKHSRNSCTLIVMRWSSLQYQLTNLQEPHRNSILRLWSIQREESHARVRCDRLEIGFA